MSGAAGRAERYVIVLAIAAAPALAIASETINYTREIDIITRIGIITLTTDRTLHGLEYPLKSLWCKWIACR
jgi:hypothetical protein